jgi:hypothetical protein
MASLKEGAETVQDVDLPLVENHRVEVLEDVSGYDDRQSWICIP